MPAQILSRILLVFFLFQVLQNRVALQSPNKQQLSHDLVAIRASKANEIRRYMNLSADPCTDFYEFACGNWPRAKEEGEISSAQRSLELRVNKDLQELLQDRVTVFDGTIGRKVKDFYASCMDAERVSKTQNTAFSEFITEFGGFPAWPESRWNENSFNWIESIATLRFRYGMDILIGLEVNADYQNHRDNRIYIREPSTLIPAEMCSGSESTSQNELSDQGFDVLQKEIADNLHAWLFIRESDATRVAGDIVSFEFSSLCKHMRRDGQRQRGRQRWSKQYPRKSLADLSSEYHGLDFQQFVTTSFGQPIPQTVYVRSEEYLTHLSKVMRTASKTTTANYIMYKALSSLSFPNDDGALHQQKQRAKLCTDKVRQHFPTVVGEMYHRKFYRDETKTDVDQMWAILKKSFDLNQQWIEENTLRQAKYKLNAMQLKFPSYSREVLEKDFHTLRIDRGNYWKNLENILEFEQKCEIGKLYVSAMMNRGPENEASDVRVQLVQLQNVIRVSFGLLQPPFYHLQYPNSIKFAQIGYRLAREMIYGFDEMGWHYDQSGAMRFWWDDTSAQAYYNRSECFRKQYSNYLYDNPERFNNQTELRKLISDSGGLNIAFNAYLLWLRTIEDHQTLLTETLPDVDFTNTQLFFLSFAQSGCLSTYAGDNNPMSAPPIDFLPMDSHTRERYQINGPLANFKEFAREFNCLPGKEMNSADKCLIY